MENRFEAKIYLNKASIIKPKISEEFNGIPKLESVSNS